MQVPSYNIKKEALVWHLCEPGLPVWFICSGLLLMGYLLALTQGHHALIKARRGEEAPLLGLSRVPKGKCTLSSATLSGTGWPAN